MKKIYQVLVVEDDANLAKLSIHHLEKFNFQVDWAENGKVALEKIGTNTYDLILTDVMMPEMDGITFLERARPLIQKTSVILITSAGDRHLVQKAQTFHASAYLLKPILPPKLLENVMGTLQLETEDLVEKKNYPFSLDYKVSQNTLKMTIKGCTDKDYWEMWNQALQAGSVKYVELSIDEEYAYSRNAYNVLDDCIKRTNSEVQIPFECIKILGKFTKTKPKKEWSKYPSLAKCNIA